MDDFTIDVAHIEEWQTLKDTYALDLVFEKAKAALVGGKDVMLARKNAHGVLEKFDTLALLEDLTAYKKSVYKYL